MVLKLSLFSFLLLMSCFSAQHYGNKFNVTEAKQRIFQSYASYCQNSSALLQGNCFWCTKQSSYFAVKITHLLSDPLEDLFGYVGFSVSLKQIVVVFRGTTDANPADWLTNFDFVKTVPYAQYPDAELHEGFWKAYKQFAAPLEKEILNISMHRCPQCSSLLFMGHSLGGALAMIAALDHKVQQRTKLPLSVFTIGQPRVGNTAMVTLLQKELPNVVRMTHKSDPVPHMPPKAIGFAHFPHEVWEYEELAFQDCRDVGGDESEDPDCSNSVSSLSFSLEDHHHYLSIDKRDGKPHQCY